MSANRPKAKIRTAVMRMQPIRTQRASNAVALRLRVIVGRAMRTMFPSSWDIKAPIVVLVRTVYLYFKLEAPERSRPVLSIHLSDLYLPHTPRQPDSNPPFTPL